MKIRVLVALTAQLLACLLVLPSVARSSHLAPGAPRPAGAPAAPRLDETRVAEAYDALPMRFEKNVGQSAGEVRYLARGSGVGVFLTASEAVVALGGGRGPARAGRGRSTPEVPRRDALRGARGGLVLRARFAGAGGATVEGLDPLPGASNYLVGDRSAWRTDVPAYGAVRYRGIAPGVDVVYRGDARELVWEVVVAPGVDASSVTMQWEGADAVEDDDAGGLVVRSGARTVVGGRPVAYELVGGAKRPVAAQLVATSGGGLGLKVGARASGATLVVTHRLVYSTFVRGLDGDGHEYSQGIAVDASGAAYVTGAVFGTSFPVVNPVDGVCDQRDAFVAKLSPEGNALVYSTYLGGESYDAGDSIAVTAAGEACVVGDTGSEQFPTANAFQPELVGIDDVFVAKLAAAGDAFVFSTYLGSSGYDAVGWSGQPEGNNVAADAAGNVYVHGLTTWHDFPLLEPYDSSLGGGWDTFVTKLSASGALAYSTFLGGSETEIPGGIAVDAAGAAYVTGTAYSTDFPVVNAYDPSHEGFGGDAYVTKLGTTGATIEYSTFVGGNGSDMGIMIAVTATGEAVVTGLTTSNDFPTANALYGAQGGSWDLFVLKLSAAGAALVFSTYLGGSDAESPGGIAVDAAGAVYVAGTTSSVDFPTANAYDDTFSDIDGFVTKIDPDGSSLGFSTFLGGSGSDFARGVAVGPSGRIYVGGDTNSSDFPTKAAYDATLSGGSDLFVSCFEPSGRDLVYSTYLGGTTLTSSLDRGYAIAVDASGAAYVTGRTTSFSFPVAGPYDGTLDGTSDVFVTKLSPGGSGLVYSTYLGGSDEETPSDVAVDAAGAAYVTGHTHSASFPQVNAYDFTANGGADAFVTKLAPAGNGLAYSTFLGGSGADIGRAIAVSATGEATVVGETTSLNFPTMNAVDATITGPSDPFVTKLGASGTRLDFSSYLGISFGHAAYDVALGPSEHVFVVGRADSVDNVDSYAFFVDLFSAGDEWVALNYAIDGTGPDAAYGVAAGADGAAYVVGETGSPDLPLVGALDATLDGARDGFVLKIAANGVLAFSTYLGGSGADGARRVALGPDGEVYVTGDTDSADFPAVDALDASANGMTDVFVTAITGAGDEMLFSTYLGGSMEDESADLAVGPGGDLYLTGTTQSPDFPLAHAYDGEPAPGGAFVARLSSTAADADTVGIYAPASGAWFLRGSNSAGPADTAFVYGPGASSLVAVSGDWDGDGADAPGLYAPATGAFFLKNSSGAGPADLTFFYGPGGAGWRPVTGDWDGDGDDTVGLYDPATGFFFLKNSNAGGAADLVFSFGPAGVAWTPIAGDWDGDGLDTPGLYDAAAGAFFLTNENANGPADLAFFYGPPGAGWRPVAGDYDGDLTDTVGLYDPSTGFFFLRNANSPGAADATFSYGPAGAVPLVGAWRI